MPTFPSDPIPSSVDAPTIQDPAVIMRVDQGYEQRRSRYSKGTRRYVLTWLGIQTNHLRILTDFFERETRVGVISFDWTHPSGTDVVVLPGNPAPVDVVGGYAHGLQTGDYVIIKNTGDPAVDDIPHTITRADADTLLLDGVNAGTGGPGTMHVHLPRTVLRAEGFTWGPTQKLRGPEINNQGYWHARAVLEEVFA